MVFIWERTSRLVENRPELVASTLGVIVGLVDWLAIAPVRLDHLVDAVVPIIVGAEDPERVGADLLP